MRVPPVTEKSILPTSFNQACAGISIHFWAKPCMLKIRSGASASAKHRRAEVGCSIAGKQATLRDYCKIYTSRTRSARASL